MPIKKFNRITDSFPFQERVSYPLFHPGSFSMITLHTNYGDITIELDFEKAPKTAANFKQYAEDGFYNDTIFHRVIDGFMIQGGGFTEDFKQKETRETIQNEADNGLPNVTGSLAMARTGDPHSATAQFFINVKDNTFLNHTGKNANGWGYCVFGKVTAGMDVVNKIKGVKTGSKGFHQDVPKEAVIIQKVSIA
jgi:peptidyl-prolyl cis-trans isomerase B (cyclophilin B)